MATACLSTRPVGVPSSMARSPRHPLLGMPVMAGHTSGDRERELVGVYLSVSPRLNRDIGVMNSDLFQNAVYGAIMDQ
jgi:hypothetical protein